MVDHGLYCYLEGFSFAMGELFREIALPVRDIEAWHAGYRAGRYVREKYGRR